MLHWPQLAVSEFGDVPIGLHVGFWLGVSSTVTHTFLSSNHPSALAIPAVMHSHIASEVSAGNTLVLSTQSASKTSLVPFALPLLALSPDLALPQKFTLSWISLFHVTNSSRPSVNLEINADNFQCDWGTFSDCVLSLLDCPPGSQVAVFNVENAYHCIPIALEDQVHIVVLSDCLAWINHCAVFGVTSSTGTFGQPADTIVVI